jgi:hypothetical protein
MKHTKEPWVAEKTLQGRDSSISNRGGKTIAIAYKNENIDGDDLANAQRIVACVNACEGITTEALEKGFVECAVRELADGAVQFYFDGVIMFEEDV